MRTSYRAVEVARVAEDSSQLQDDQAQDAYRIAAAQCRAGMVPFYSMRQAQLDLLKAKLNRSGAHFDYLAARLKLDFACGEEPRYPLPTRGPCGARAREPLRGRRARRCLAALPQGEVFSPVA